MNEYRQRLMRDLAINEALMKRQEADLAQLEDRLKTSLGELLLASKEEQAAARDQLNGAGGGSSGGLPVGPGGGGPATGGGAPAGGGGGGGANKGPSPRAVRARAYEMLTYQASIARSELLATRRRVTDLRELLSRPTPPA